MPIVTAVHNVEGNTVLFEQQVGAHPWVDTADGSTSYIAGSGHIEWYGGGAGTLPETEIPIFLQMQVYPVGTDPFIRYRPMDDDPDGSGGFSTGPWSTINLAALTSARDEWVTLDPIEIPGEHVWVYGGGYWPTWRSEFELSPGTRISWIALVELADDTVPYRRIYPRDDGLAGGAARNYPPSKSVQAGSRTSGGYL